jgi:hypothetical protein
MKLIPRRNRKWLYALLLLFSLSLGYTMNVIHAVDPTPRFYVDPPSLIDTSLLPPKTFNVSIKVADVTNLAGYEYKIAWDKSILNFVSVKDFVPYTSYYLGKNVTTNNYNATHGRMYFVVVDTSGAPFTGSTTLREITFKVTGIGSTIVDLFSTILGDPFANPITHTVGKGFFSNVPIIPARIQIQPSKIIDPELKPPKNFTIDVNIINAKNLYNFDLKISYNTTVLDVAEIKEGPFLKSFGTTIVNKMEDNPVTGTIWIAISLVSPAPPANGNGTLAIVTFNVTQLGESKLHLYDIKLTDKNGATLLYETADGYFNNVLLAKLYVDPPSIIDPSLTPASTFSIDIKIANVTNLYGYEFKLLYDTSFLNGIGVLIYPQPPNETHFTPRVEINDKNGMIFVNVTDYPPAEPISTIAPVKLVTITFQVQTYGASVLDLNQTKLVDNEGAPIVHVAVDGFVSVKPPDVAILKVTAAPTLIYPGTMINIEVVAANLGIFRKETFNVTTYYGATKISTVTVTDLPPLTNITLPFSWNTASVPPNDYLISARASTVPLEINTTNNFLSDGTVSIVTPDVAVLNVVPAYNSIYQGWKINITVYVANQGLLPINFSVTVYYDNNTIGTQTVTNLESHGERLLVFWWNTTGVPYCHNYTISANATIIPGEIDIADNSYTALVHVKVRIPGDLNNDRSVDILDLILVSEAFDTKPGDLKYNMYADINRDGSIDVIDMIIVSTKLGTSC